MRAIIDNNNDEGSYYMGGFIAPMQQTEGPLLGATADSQYAQLTSTINQVLGNTDADVQRIYQEGINQLTALAFSVPGVEEAVTEQATPVIVEKFSPMAALGIVAVLGGLALAYETGQASVKGRR